MMLDYCAFQQSQLIPSLTDLEQANAELKRAKDISDKDERRTAIGKWESKLRQAANTAAKIEPHVAYLWCEANASELKNSIRDAWQERLAVVDLQQEHREHFDFLKIPNGFRFTPDTSAAAHLPPLSFLLSIPFRLRKPYLSKDERDFYLLDNSLRREKIFKTPMVAATGWKGALRAALWQLGYKEKHEVTLRLLGNPRSSEEGQAGRLYFYSTFFNKISLEVINPHNREKGIGEQPILMECVPQGTAGDLVLLYVPFGPIDQQEDGRRNEVAQDLEVLTEGIQAMLTIFGFGAKTSSGFGIADEQLSKLGTLALRAVLPGFAAPHEPSTDGIEQAQLEMAQFVARHGLLEFPRWTKKELEQNNWGQKKQSEYKRLRKVHPDWDDQTHAWRALRAEAASVPATPPLTQFDFATLSDLPERSRRLAAQLREEEGR